MNLTSGTWRSHSRRQRRKHGRRRRQHRPPSRGLADPVTPSFEALETRRLLSLSDIDGTLDTSTWIGSAIIQPESVTGTIGADALTTDFDSDVDIYGFSTQQGQTIDFSLIALSQGSPLRGSLRIFDSAGTEIASSIGTATDDPFLSITFDHAGLHYVGISNAVHTAYDPQATGDGPEELESWTKGSYTLRLTSSPLLAGESAVSHTLSGNQFGTAFGFDALGRSVHVYRSLEKGNAGSFVRRLDADGQPINDFQLTATPASDPTIAVAPSGDFVVTWTEFDPVNRQYRLAARYFDAAGAEFLPRDQLQLGSASGTPCVAIHPTGDFVIAFANRGVVYLQRFGEDAGTHLIGTPTEVMPEVGRHQALPSTRSVQLALDGVSHVLWKDADQLFWRRFDVYLQPLESAQVIASSEQASLPFASDGSQPETLQATTSITAAEIELAPDGRIFVAGQYAYMSQLAETNFATAGHRSSGTANHSYQNFVRIRDVNAGWEEPLIVADSERSEDHEGNTGVETVTSLGPPSLAADAFGRWGITWREDHTDSSEGRVLIRRQLRVQWFATGQRIPLTPAFTYATAAATHTILEADSLGRYVAVSRQSGGSPTFYDVISRQFRLNTPPQLSDRTLSHTIFTHEIPSDNPGIAASELVEGLSDHDAGNELGIAIVDIDTSRGPVEFSRDGGETWKHVNFVSEQSALLLPARDNYRLRWLADPTGQSVIPNALHFRGWDITAGVAESYVDLASGDGTAFSPTGDSLEVAISPLAGSYLVNRDHTTGVQFGVATGIDGLGRAVHVYRDFDGESTLRIQRVAPNGTMLGDIAIPIADVNDPTVAVAANGNFVVAWTVFNAADSGYDVFAQPFEVLGTQVVAGNLFLVGQSNRRAPAVAMHDDGTFAILWTNHEYQFMYREYRRAGDAYVAGGSSPIDDATTSPESLPSQRVAVYGPQGDLHVLWHRDGSLWTRSIARNGLSGPVEQVTSMGDFSLDISDDGRSIPRSDDYYFFGELTLGPDGSLLVAGQAMRRLVLGDPTGGSSDLAIYYRYRNFARLKPTAASWKPLIDLGSAERSEVYQAGTAVASGTALSPPSLAMDSRDRFGIAWRTDSYDDSPLFDDAEHTVYAQWYDALAGLPSGPQLVLSRAAISQTWLAANSQGVYVATSLEFRDDVSSYDIIGQRLEPGPFVPGSRPAPRFLAISDRAAATATSLSVPLRVIDELSPAPRLAYMVVGEVPGTHIVVDPLDTREATFTWSTPEDEGIYPITLRVFDEADPSRSDLVTFQVHVGAMNEPPVVSPIADQIGDSGQLLRFTMNAADPDGPQRLLRYALAEGAPAGASIHPVTGEFEWTPTPDQAGVHFVDLTARDQGFPQLSGVATVRITVLPHNRPPIIAAPSHIAALEDQPFSFLGDHRITLTDFDAQGELTLSLFSEFGQLALSPASGLTFEVGAQQPANRIKVRGALAELNDALTGLMFFPTAHFHGQTTLEIALDDRGNGGSHLSERTDHQMTVVVAPQLDPPVVSDQTLFFTPNSQEGALDIVGYVEASDPDPAHVRSFRIVGGNADESFVIDSGTGRLIATRDDAVLPGASRVLTVEAYYEIADIPQVGSGQITVHGVPTANAAPIAYDDFYTLNEDDVLLGNLLTDGSADYDSDGDPLQLMEVYDAHHTRIEWGVPTQLPTGGTLTISQDGEFRFEAHSPWIDAQFDPGAPDQYLYETLRYVIGDTYEGLDEAQVQFTIVPVNDPHGISDHSFTVAPGSPVGTIVGQLLVDNPEPTESFFFELVAGNEAGIFRIENDGELVVERSESLIDGDAYELTVQVADYFGNTASALVNMSIVENGPPVLHNMRYTTIADFPTMGNLLSDAVPLGSAYDPEAGPLTVIAVDGSSFAIGRTIPTGIGASLQIEPDGSFVYDPSGSQSLTQLPSGGAWAESFRIRVRDEQGATSEAALQIDVLGRNRAPWVFDKDITVADYDTVSGNLIEDPSGESGFNGDPNYDELFLRRVGTIEAGTTDTAMTTHRGGVLTFNRQGRFVYDPTNINVDAMAPGDRLYDAVTYTIADGAGGEATGVLRMEIIVSDPQPQPFRVGDVRLQNDTPVNGGSEHDLISDDPWLTGTFSGGLANAVAFDLEFDGDAAAQNGFQNASELEVNATLRVINTDVDFPHFSWDPRTTSEFGGFGEKAIAYRARAYDANGNLVDETSWDYFAFTWLASNDAGPIRIDDVRLFYDTGWIDPDSGTVAEDDGITTDPRLAAYVAGDFDYLPFGEGDSRFVEIEFHHERSGIAYEGMVSVASPDMFLYDPREADPGLSDFAGPLVIDYAASLVEDVGGNISSVPIASGTVDFYYYTVPPSCLSVELREVPAGRDAGYQGSRRDLLGTVSWTGGSCGPTGEQAFVEFDYADALGDFDDIPDSDLSVLLPGDDLDQGGVVSSEFEFTAIGLPSAQPQVRGRSKTWSPEYGDYQYGPWSTPLILSEAVSPSIASLVNAYEPVEGRMLPVLSGYLEGAVDDTNGNATFDPGRVAFVPVEFYHRDEWPFSDSWMADGRAMTTAQGSFEYRPTRMNYAEYEYGGRIWARSISHLDDGTAVYGPPSFVTVTVERPQLPSITNLSLFDESQAMWTGSRWTTSDTRIVGRVDQFFDDGVRVDDINLEFAHDDPSDPLDDNEVVGLAQPNANGEFSYAPLLSVGNVDLRVRTAYFDQFANDYVFGPWYPHALPLDVTEATNEWATVVDLRLLRPVPGTANPQHTSEATVTGRIENPDGYVDFVNVEFRDSNRLIDLGVTTTDTDGQFAFSLPGLVSGESYTIEVRTFDWDYQNAELVAGPWTTSDSYVRSGCANAARDRIVRLA